MEERNKHTNNHAGIYMIIGIVLGSIAILTLIISCLSGAFVMKLITDQRIAEIENSRPTAAIDTVIQDSGFLGYTVSDFQDVIVGTGKQESELIVYTVPVTEKVPRTQSGFLNIDALEMKQTVTYYGDATYVVNLSGLSKDNITVDNDEETVTISVPHAKLYGIDIPSDKVIVSDVERGSIFAIGEMELSIDESNQLETTARKNMEYKLYEEDAASTADSYALDTIKRLFQPLIEKIAEGYKVEIVFE